MGSIQTPNTTSLGFQIHDGTKSVEEFARDRALLMTFLFPGYILILNNAPNHIGKSHKVLAMEEDCNLHVMVTETCSIVQSN